MTQADRTTDLTEPAVQRSFDDARWPTNLALLLLAGLTCGLVVLAGGFDDPRLLHNGWVRLATLVVTLAGLGVAANTVCPRRARRLQMAVLLSLLLHILLAVFLHEQHLRRADQDVPPQPPIEVEELTTPQYVEVTAPMPDRPFEEPVAADVDDQVAEQVDVSRSEVTRSEPLDMLATTEPEEDLPTATTREREMAPAAPHQSQTWSRLSRQTREEEVRSSPLQLAQQDPQIPREDPRDDERRLQPSSIETERSSAGPTLVEERDVAPDTHAADAATELTRGQAEDPEPQLAQSRADVPRELAPQPSAPAPVVEDLPSAQMVDAAPVQTLQPETDSPSRRDPQQALASAEVSADDSVAVHATDVERETSESPIEPETAVAEVIEPDRESMPAEISPEVSLAEAAATPRAVEVPAEQHEGDLDAQPTNVVRTNRSHPPADPEVDPAGTVRETMVAGTVDDSARTRASDNPDLDPTAAPAVPQRIVQEADAVTAPADGSVGQVAATDEQAASSPTPVDAAETGSSRVVPGPVLASGPAEAPPDSGASYVADSPTDRRRTPTGLATAEPVEPSGGTDLPRRSPADAAHVADAGVDLDAAPGAPAASTYDQIREDPAPSRVAAVQRTVAQQEPSAEADAVTTSVDSTNGDANGPAIAAVGAARRTIESARPQQDRELPAAPRSATTAELPRIEMSLADLPAAAETPPVGDDEAADMPTLRQDATSPVGRSELAVDVDIEQDVREGGLAVAPADSSGSPDRRAQRQSQLVRIEPDRFLRPRAGGVAAIGGDVRAPAPAFVRRTRRQESPTERAAGQPSAKTEAAIEAGLVYLARHQMKDGRWSLAYNGVDLRHAPRERPQLQADTAATGLALLAFLGAGYDHYDDQYRDVVARGIRFLVDNQKENGDLYLEEDANSNRFNHFYSHGIASIALCEAYGMTGDAALREPAQQAIDFIVASQHPVHGGWRYAPGDAAFSSDLSVSGWQVMALKSGELAGLDVPQQAYDEARRFLAQCATQGSEGRRYVYNPWAVSGDQTQQHGARPSTVMTAVGLLLDLYLGSNRQRPELRQGADHLLTNLPTHGSDDSIPDIGTIGNPQRDTYYWYYATLVMFHMKGEHWQKWNETLHPLLVNSQSQTGRLAGSWNPLRPVRDQWAPQAGRLYVTTMNLLSLEVYYRHLPLYHETGK